MTPNDDSTTEDEPMRVCGECDWFAPSSGAWSRGECRKRAPSITPDGTNAAWPRVAELHWCGDWRASDDTER